MVLILSWGSADDIYIAKYDGATGNVLWARKAGGWDSDELIGLAIDNNYLYVAANYHSNYIYMNAWVAWHQGNHYWQSSVLRLSKTDLFPNKIQNMEHWIRAIDAGKNHVYLGGEIYYSPAKKRVLVSEYDQNLVQTSVITDLDMVSPYSAVSSISVDPTPNNEIVNFCGYYDNQNLIMGPSSEGQVIYDGISSRSGFVAQFNFFDIPPVPYIVTPTITVKIELNPTTANNISFTLIATSAERVNVTLVNDLSGAIEYQNYFNVVEGENRFSISLNRLEKGTYSLVAQSPSGSTSKHVVIE